MREKRSEQTNKAFVTIYYSLCEKPKDAKL